MTLRSYLGRVRSSSYDFRDAVERDFLERGPGRYIPVRPHVIQLPVNDICNSRCVMCDIWRQEPTYEITPDQLGRVLASRMFSAVRYVGVSGGEPTLRKDLPEIGKALVDTLPKLTGFGIITNAVGGHACVDRIAGLASVARDAGKGFSVTVSLDGLHQDHDRNRGKTGNFLSAVKVIEDLRREDIVVGVGCTLTPVNCYGADDLLAWCENADIQYWEFHLGVQIKRLYNEEFPGLRGFGQRERFHLVNFFDQLAADPRVDKHHRRFYRSLVAQIAFGAPRSAGCDWRSRGITLDSRGDLSFCSVESPILGSVLEDDPAELYRRRLGVRREILATKCDTCQHDLLGPPSARVAGKELLDVVAAPIVQRAQGWARQRLIPKASGRRAPGGDSSPASWRRVMVTGWYGTETAGDKAILAEVVHFVLSRAPNCEFVITTLNRAVSEQTNREIEGLADATVVDLRAAAGSKVVESCDAVILGGGPLEEIETLSDILAVFEEADRQRKPRIIFGCGVGPLYSRRLKSIVSKILSLSTAGFVRDRESQILAQQLGASSDIACACDPSLGFLTRWRNRSQIRAASNGARRLAGLLRANTHEYLPGMKTEQIDNTNQELVQKLGVLFDNFGKRPGAETTLLPMHSLWIGGDDRLFNRKVRASMDQPESCWVERRYLTIEDLLLTLSDADATLAMRYHGHLFSLALGIPFVSIDYTGPNGKVAALVRRLNHTAYQEPWSEFDVERCERRIEELFNNHGPIKSLLLERADEMAADLEASYAVVFN